VRCSLVLMNRPTVLSTAYKNARNYMNHRNKQFLSLATVSTGTLPSRIKPLWYVSRMYIKVSQNMRGIDNGNLFPPESTL
jgi:hypothetical protein